MGRNKDRRNGAAAAIPAHSVVAEDDLVEIDDGELDSGEVGGVPLEVVRAPQVFTRELIDVPIRVPVIADTPKYEDCNARVDLTLWRQSTEFYTMARLRIGLTASGATLKNGKIVDSNADVVRWLLEQVEVAIRE